MPANGTYTSMDKLYDDDEVPSYRNIQFAGAVIAIGVAQIFIGASLGALTLAHKFPDYLYTTFLVYTGIQVFAAIALIAGVYRRWADCVWFNLCCQIANVCFATTGLVFTFKNQFKMNYFLTAYHWRDPYMKEEEQERLGHIILGAYSAILMVYILFTIGTFIVISFYQKELLKTRSFEEACARCCVLASIFYVLT
uniref:MARVEL domain-containing protein n=1 Tax=Steinernema glaseri TaxID=37863 RepID=A0A1I7YCY9_9BILA